jgi:hypothetical protein
MALDDDLRAEIDFHVDMRTQKHLNAGMTPAEAEALARRQFGDMEAAMNGMRLARLRSSRTAVIAVTFTLAAVALWLYLSPASGPVQLPAVHVQSKIQKRPPPPPPPPTWKEFVAKVNTFGEPETTGRGSAVRRSRQSTTPTPR